MRHLALASLLAFAALAAHADDQARSVGPFNAVSNSGPISVSIEVGKAISVTASGSSEFLDALVTEVADGELRIRLKDKHLSHIKGDPKITITLPQLTRYDMSGAGETTITRVNGEALDVSMSGAGSLKASGDVKNLKLSLSGVGSVDARGLHAENVSATVAGVGSVKVYASARIDASVGGVGSLTYYGDPKTVNTSGGRLGSISHGK
jgi:hypothetical protein